MDTNLDPATDEAARLIDFDSVCRLLGRRPDSAARLALWRHARTGVLPAPRKVGHRNYWDRAEILARISSLPRASYGLDAVASEAARG